MINNMPARNTERVNEYLIVGEQDADFGIRATSTPSDNCGALSYHVDVYWFKNSTIYHGIPPHLLYSSGICVFYTNILQ